MAGQSVDDSYMSPRHASPVRSVASSIPKMARPYLAACRIATELEPDAGVETAPTGRPATRGVLGASWLTVARLASVAVLTIPAAKRIEGMKPDPPTVPWTKPRLPPPDRQPSVSHSASSKKHARDPPSTHRMRLPQAASWLEALVPCERDAYKGRTDQALVCSGTRHLLLRTGDRRHRS